jgi:hypothetical protein
MQSPERMERRRVITCRMLEQLVSDCLELATGSNAATWQREARFWEAARLRYDNRMQLIVRSAAGEDVPEIERNGKTVGLPELAALQAALLSAFNEAGLRQVVKFEMGVDMTTIAGGEDDEERVFNLVQWAARTGRLAALLAGALHQNPSNPALLKLAGQP